MIREGSVIKHIPTGEEWYVLGVRRLEDKVCIAGYPPTIAHLSDCIELEEGSGISAEELEYRNEEFGFRWD